MCPSSEPRAINGATLDAGAARHLERDVVGGGDEGGLFEGLGLGTRPVKQSPAIHRVRFFSCLGIFDRDMFFSASTPH